jgi:hypothetical protein
MALDRSKFQGAKVSALKDVQKNARENDKPLLSNGGDGRVGFLSVEEGRNVFRILPPHPEDKVGASYLPKRVAMLKCEVNIWKDGEKTDKTEIKNKNIYIATQHGGLTKDPIELYIEYVRNYANDAFDNKEDRQKFLSPITGWKDKKGTWNWGITPKITYVAYAVKDGKVGRLELWESWVKEMDKLAISEDADDVMMVDPFSDPNEGFPLVIIKEKAVDKQGKETGKWEYNVQKESLGRKESWDDFFERTQVTDSQLEELIKQEPLSKLYGRDIYTRNDWDLAMDGLRRFDSENKYGIFDNDDFIEELQGLSELVKEAPKSDDSDVNKMFKVNDSIEEDESIDEITPTDMKIALKRFIRKEFGEQYVDQIPSGKELQKWYSLYEDGDGDKIPIKVAKKTVKEGKEDEFKSNDDSVHEEEVSNEIQKLRERRRASK